MKSICNIINFVRGVNQAHPDINYMLKPVKEHLRLAKQNNFDVTFLLQYDALIDDRFVSFLKNNADSRLEIGLWFEIPKQLTDKIGFEWKGAPDSTWDHHTNVGFLVGYTPEERFLIIDTCFEKFKEIMGYYPKVIGSWILDAVSLAYIESKYDVSAACICREQIGTDGYTLWGGYQNAYYPCRNNSFAPAQNSENQINIPVFRMLGIDITYVYDNPYLTSCMGYPEFPPMTMEPVFAECGGNEKFVRWFLNEQQNPENMPFAYYQAGQENGFGWHLIGPGMELQMPIMRDLVNSGRLVVEKVSATGERFKSEFSETPVTVSVAKNDWMDGERESYWYYCKSYRSNLYVQGKHFWIRDLYKYSDDYKERFLSEVCTTHDAVFDNLPMVDGFRWSNIFVRAGLYPARPENGNLLPLTLDSVEVNSTDTELNAEVQTDCGNISISFAEKIEISGTAVWKLQYDAASSAVIGWSENAIKYINNNEEYSLNIEIGKIDTLKSLDGNIVIRPENGRIVFGV